MKFGLLKNKNTSFRALKEVSYWKMFEATSMGFNEAILYISSKICHMS